MLFDRYVVVDWSASSIPRRGVDSIWVAVVDDTGMSSANPSTRVQAVELLDDVMSAGSDRRTLVGMDASLGYPAGTAAALGLDGEPWAAMWTLLADVIVDDARNVNNRFAVAAELNRRIGASPGPFWGCPPRAAGATLATTKPVPGALAEWRRTERCLRASGHRPHSCWQLLGAGSVGSQSLLAIAHLERLRRHHGERVHVWPFTTGSAPPACRPGDVVVAEVWPSLVTRPVAGDRRVRDEAQVEDTAARLAAADASGELRTWLSPAAFDDRAAVVAEEGWVLGVVAAAAEEPILDA